MGYFTDIARSEGDPSVVRTGPSSLGTSDRLARGLGWFSIGLGIAQLVAAERMTRAIGMEGKERHVRACGAREIGQGLAVLSIDKQAGLWSRVAGDALDVAALLPALDERNPKRQNAAIALAGVIGVTILDIVAASAVGRHHARPRGPARDYGDRSGFPGGVAAARGAARKALDRMNGSAGRRSEQEAVPRTLQ